MPLSNFAGGFPEGVIIRNVPVLNVHTGDVYWVDSNNGSDGNRGTFGNPFASLDYAIGQCTADNGDIIVIKANHSETITGAGGITADVAGITIIGQGTFNNRPRFLMDGATTVTFVVSAADVRIENCVFAGGHNGIATCFDIDAVGFTAVNVEFEDNTTDEHFIIGFTVGSTTDNTCDGLTIVGCRWETIDTGVTHFIDVTGDLDRATIVGNFFCADAAGGAQLLSQASGDDLQGLYCCYNTIISGGTSGDVLIENDQTDNTGVAAFNMAGHHDTAGPTVIDADGIRVFENYSAATDTASGRLWPAVEAT